MATATKSNTLRDYLSVLFRHKSVIIATVVIIMALTFIGLELKTPVYKAQTTMFVAGTKRVESRYYKEVFDKLSEITSAQGMLTLSNPVIERTVRNLHLDKRPLDYEKQFSSGLKAALIDFRLKKIKAEIKAMTPEQKEDFFFRRAVKNLKSNLRIRTVFATSLFTIRVKDFDPEKAAAIANTVSRSYVIFDLEMQLAEFALKFGEKHFIPVQLKDNIEMIKKRLNGKLLPNGLEAIGPGSVKIIEQAVTPDSPAGISRPVIFTLALLSSWILGIVLAFKFDNLWQPLNSPQDVEKFLNIPLLGSIPKKGTAEYKRSYQNLSDRLYISMKERNLKTLLILHAERPEESAAIAAEIGGYLARKARHETLIIDADLRSPAVSGILDISNDPGMVDVLEKKISFEDAVQYLGLNLYVLPAGDTEFSPVPLLDSPTMPDILKKSKEQYKLILITCPGLKNFKEDARILSSAADATALVMNADKAKRRAAVNAVAELTRKKVNLIGIILTNRKYVIPEIIYKLT